MERDFFTGLPEGKETGLCQTEPNSGEAVVIIRRDCIRCQIGYCMMFKTTLDSEGKITKRIFVNNPPAYKK